MNRLAWHNSLTIFWARCQMVVGMVLLVAGQAVEIAQTANVMQFVPPKWTAPVLFGMGIVTELARRRKEWQRHD